MTYWKDVPDARIPDPDDSWDRPAYDEIAALDRDALVRLSWNLTQALHGLEGEALNLAQDLSCEFEMCDYTGVKEEFRHEVSLERQARGMGYMRHAYALAGFSDERREGIRAVAAQFTAARFGGANG